MIDYVMVDESMRGWDNSYSSHSWFKRDKYGVLWQAYDNGFDPEMQFRTLGDKLGENSPMVRPHFEGLFRA